MKKLLWLVFVLAFFQACNTSEPEPSGSPVTVVRPACRLVREDLGYYNSNNQYRTYHYEGNKLTRFVLYYNGAINSDSRLIYENQDQTIRLASFDSENDSLTPYCTFEYQDGLLKKYIRGGLINQPSITEYIYENGHLRKIISNHRKENIYEMEQTEVAVETDAKGNPVIYTLLKVDGKIPHRLTRTVLEYDDKINPFYHLPINIFFEDRYFNQNNLIKKTTYSYLNSPTPGPYESSFAYLSNQLPSKLELYSLGHGTNSYYYTYECD